MVQDKARDQAPCLLSNFTCPHKEKSRVEIPNHTSLREWILSYSWPFTSLCKACFSWTFGENPESF